LSEIGGCKIVEVKYDYVLAECPSCSIFFRGSFVKSVNGIKHKKNVKRQMERASVTMDSLTAKAMVNIARVRPGDLVLEPFVGTGAIALEAASIGAKTVGLDISVRYLKTALKNGVEDVINADAIYPPVKKADAVIGDPPYGRLSQSDMEIKKLLYLFLEISYSIVKNNGYIVIASPIYINLWNLNYCYMYLHGGLYRVLYFVRV